MEIIGCKKPQCSGMLLGAVGKMLYSTADNMGSGPSFVFNFSFLLMCTWAGSRYSSNTGVPATQFPCGKLIALWALHFTLACSGCCEHVGNEPADAGFLANFQINMFKQ